MARRSLLFLLAAVAWINSPVLGQDPNTDPSKSPTATPQKSQKQVERLEELTSKVTKVIDGDSFKVQGADGKEIEVQIEGIDAPELKQEYGKESMEALKKLLVDSDVRLTWTKKDNFERPLAQVYRGQTHINSEMIKTGNAWHFKRYNQSQALADLEVEAKKNKLGLWKADNPIAPWDYRKENRSPDKPDR